MTLQLSGERHLLNAHKTMYLVFSGVDTSITPSENVSVIGEVWNCPSSGTSVICIGMAYLTHTTNHTVNKNTANWAKIIADAIESINGFSGKAGLIDHVRCHQ